jgi:hypothetical protein
LQLNGIKIHIVSDGTDQFDIPTRIPHDNLPGKKEVANRFAWFAISGTDGRWGMGDGRVRLSRFLVRVKLQSLLIWRLFKIAQL